MVRVSPGGAGELPHPDQRAGRPPTKGRSRSGIKRKSPGATQRRKEIGDCSEGLTGRRGPGDLPLLGA